VLKALAERWIELTKGRPSSCIQEPCPPWSQMRTKVSALDTLSGHDLRIIAIVP